MNFTALPFPAGAGGVGGLTSARPATTLKAREKPMDQATRTEIEAAAFRALREHLIDKRPEVQNIDLMTLAGFCRNCLSRWYQEAANSRGIPMSKDEARAIFYGIPYAEWTARNQTQASPEQQAAFDKAFAENVKPKP
jgi:hypothetical protein